MSVHKRLTTPHDPSQAVTEGIAALLKTDARRHRRRQRGRARHHARHQRGDRAARARSPACWRRRASATSSIWASSAATTCSTCASTYPPPLVPRRLRLEVPERVRFDGSVELPLDEAAVRGAAQALPGAGRRRRRRLLPAFLCQPGARDARRRDSARGGARAVRLRVGRRISQHARVRALDDDDRQRLHAADVRPLPRAAGDRAWPPRASAAGSTSWHPAAAR